MSTCFSKFLRELGENPWGCQTTTGSFLHNDLDYIVSVNPVNCDNPMDDGFPFSDNPLRQARQSVDIGVSTYGNAIVLMMVTGGKGPIRGKLHHPIV